MAATTVKAQAQTVDGTPWEHRHPGDHPHGASVDSSDLAPSRFDSATP